ncbi:2Fe-2S iron-sulfur cluster-binding protein [Sphingomonas sp. MG17]|uniref:2Fe-2S iron-sulfur cluster-binding protein n=1 Tax=Sphingomonas tagetis TaxID=2949092 RepID=A0A9X2HJH9_9SPHN|nr:2Fe-2S iron-sulfur cluster-binding protein [Sphingomonas tagetis]MCP3730041.1 2Fe-2S iron-sulfur cluster-binding protein [Sphingomonas tagetis]
MPIITYTQDDGTVRRVDAAAGLTVMEVALQQGVSGIAADCGGALSCATCHVYVAPDWFDRLVPASEDELAMLEFTFDPQPNSRLSCQIEIVPALDGLEVAVPARQF